MGSQMTDEELSELAECLQDACTTVPPPFSVSSELMDRGGLSCCPMGALCGVTGWVGHRFPLPDYVEGSVKLPMNIAGAFIRGFDGGGTIPSDDPRAFALGRLFREQYR
jgi:hypothetical protein